MNWIELCFMLGFIGSSIGIIAFCINDLLSILNKGDNKE